ncbi:MAG: F0F1-ATPase subunit [Flavobacteriales bacterium 32-34-25]|nr:MAG: F0F1-ATPase subunit [Flavobacteriales bacterium 32-34-25]
MENKPNNKRPSSKWLALINIPIQMGVIIFLFSYLGDWLDENHPNPKFYYNKVLVMVGVFLALYNVIRQVNEINKEKE